MTDPEIIIEFQCAPCHECGGARFARPVFEDGDLMGMTLHEIHHRTCTRVHVFLEEDTNARDSQRPISTSGSDGEPSK